MVDGSVDSDADDPAEEVAHDLGQHYYDDMKYK